MSKCNCLLYPLNERIWNNLDEKCSKFAKILYQRLHGMI